MFNNGDIYEKNENGKVYCGKNIMLSIINLAAKEISGVSSLSSNFGSRLRKFFSTNSSWNCRAFFCILESYSRSLYSTYKKRVFA